VPSTLGHRISNRSGKDWHPRYSIRIVLLNHLRYNKMALINPRIDLVCGYHAQCSQRGSPSVLGQDEDGRHFVVPSRLFQNLPDRLKQGTRTDDIVSSRPVIFRTCPTSKSQGPGRTTLCRPPSSPTVLCRPPPSPAVFRCFPMFSAVPCRPPSSPAALCRDLPSHTRRCLTSWGSSSFVMTAVLEVQGRERTAFCRPVRSFSKVARQVGMKDEDGPRPAVPSRPGLLAVPPPGPTGAPDGCEH